MNNSSSAKVLTFVQDGKECISAFSQNRIIFKYRIRLFTRRIKRIMIHGLVYFSRFQLSSSIIFNDYNPATRISYDCQTFEFSDCSKCFALIKLFLIWSFPVKFDFFCYKVFSSYRTNNFLPDAMSAKCPKCTKTVYQMEEVACG